MEAFIDIFNANRFWIMPGILAMLVCILAHEARAFFAPDYLAIKKRFARPANICYPVSMIKHQTETRSEYERPDHKTKTGIGFYYGLLR